MASNNDSSTAPPPVFSPGNTILISGAASGIGLAVASLCYTKHGMNLILVDNNAELLSLAGKGFAPSSTQAVHTHVMDVSSRSAWSELKTKIVPLLPHGGRLDALMLNAGIAAKTSWDDSASFDQILGVNLFGQVYGLNTFVPLLQRPRAQAATPAAIIMTGSKQGITNPPGSSAAYNASKAAVKALAERLSYDLRDSLTSVTLLVPGWTFTGLSGGAPGSTKQKPDGAWSPAQVADRLDDAVRARQFWCICPDNDVTEEMDQRRMMWTAGDAVHSRPPLSRWRDETKDEAEQWMAERRF